MILIVNSLISLEDRLVSLHIAFTQICQLGYKRSQLGLIGTIINIPYDVALIMIYQEIVIFHDNCCAPKIKLKYKSMDLSRNGRPTVVMHALYKLCRTTLYKEEQIVIHKQREAFFHKNTACEATTPTEPNLIYISINNGDTVNVIETFVHGLSHPHSIEDLHLKLHLQKF
jgi:hypothetical protein